MRAKPPELLRAACDQPVTIGASSQVSDDETEREVTENHPSTTPARGYSWPTATPGNVIALRHGAYSDRLLIPRAREIFEATASVCEWWAAADVAAARDWAKTEARIECLEEYLAKHAIADTPDELDFKGDIRAATTLLLRCQTHAANLRSKLGLDPVSRAKLQRDSAAAVANVADIAATLAEGQRAREAAEQRDAASARSSHNTDAAPAGVADTEEDTTS